MKVLNRITLFTHILKFLLIISVALACGVATAQEVKETKKDKQDKGEFTLEEITVTAQFQETNLQKTPIAISAFTGDMLENQNIQSVKDLGLVIPNAVIKEMGNASGPNTQVFLRGVGQADFIPALEPGVGVYVDDIYVETLVGSMMDLLDLERVEVLRGPQGTLAGKNNLGGSIRLISKAPRGDNTGHLQVTYGDLHRIDFSGGYDFSVIEDKLFARFSASSRKIDGYVDVLDFACQMQANGTPELAGSFPVGLPSNKTTRGDCKIGEKGGSQSDAAKLVLRWLPADRWEFNFGADYTETVADPNAETLLKGLNPDHDAPANIFNAIVQDTLVDPAFNTEPGDAFTILGDNFVTGNPFTVYESYRDPLGDTIWPRKSDEWYKNFFAKIDYDITDTIHGKFIFGYRAYEQIFATTNDTPMSFNAYLIDMEHEQKSYELRINGLLFNERLDWTVGAYYFDSSHDYGGHITLGTFGYVLPPLGFDNNDYFTTESKSAFAHAIFAITDKFSVTAGGRTTTEDKTFSFDHTNFLTIEDPLEYGESFSDWKLSFDYQITEDIMTYISAATGYRADGAVSRPWNASQLESVGNEELIAYELGAKTSFFDNRLRINAAAFYQDYDPRQIYIFGAQCSTDPYDHGEYIFPWGAICPEGTDLAGTVGTYASVYLSAPGQAKGLEFDISARPMDGLDLNGSFSYYDYDTDVKPDNPGYVHPDYKAQPEFTGSLGAQYRIDFQNGSLLVPRIDIFYQGEYNNNGPRSKPVAPYHVVPSYTRVDGRLTYLSKDTHWSLSLEVQNMFDKFYWNALTAELSDDLSAPTFSRTGFPGRPRTFALTLRYNIF